MTSSAAVVRRIMKSPAPVLLPDTCSLLDLMRDPSRITFSVDKIQAAKRLLARAEAHPKTVWIPIASQVLTERQGNQSNISRETEAAINKLQAQIDGVQSIFTAHGLVTTAITPSLVASDFPRVAGRMVDAYFSAALHVGKPRGADQKALARIAVNKAPSKRGQQAKDCVVIESYLYLAKLLRRANFKDPIVFLTSNTKDYSDPNRAGALHADLTTEFASVNMSYAVNFPMAEVLLK